MAKRLVRAEWITVDCSSSFQTLKKFHFIIYLVSTIRGKIDKGTPSRLVIIELHSICQKKYIDEKVIISLLHAVSLVKLGLFQTAKRLAITIQKFPLRKRTKFLS